MFNAAQSAKVIPRQPPRYEAPKNATERWNNILSQNDPRKVWKSIDWKGQFTDVPSSVSTPSDEEFCKCVYPDTNEPIYGRGFILLNFKP